MTKDNRVGIASIGLHIPNLFISMQKLAEMRNVDPEKYLTGLGCGKIALCPSNVGIEDLALRAAQRALSRWEGDPAQIGLIAVGTESALDMSRPLSAWVAEKLQLSGAIRSYEVKHACYGGTLALRQATEWKLAGIAPQKAALVISADISMYADHDPGEPTGGAGAIAFIIDQPNIAVIQPQSFAFSKPVFDFWRPVGNAFPSVQGELSLQCYKDAVQACFSQLLAGRDFETVLNEFKAVCFHTPFPKMVLKAFLNLCASYGVPLEKAQAWYEQKVGSTMDWNRAVGNSYTASLWLAVAKALTELQPGDNLAAFSYGSGCGAELLLLTAGDLAHQAAWRNDFDEDMAKSHEVNAKEYEQLRHL